MRSKKRFMAILIAMMMFLVYCTCSLAAANEYTVNLYELNTDYEFSEAFITNAQSANLTYTDWIDSLKNRNMDTLETYSDVIDEFSYSINGLYAEDYPDYFAGSYINIYGNLVMMVTEDSAQTQEMSLKNEIHTFSSASNIYYTTARYSYSELINIMTQIHNYYITEEYEKQDYIIYGFGLDDYQNKVIIYVNTLEEDVKNHIIAKAEIEETDAILFELQENDFEDQATVAHSGDGIGTSAGNNTFSVAFRAKYTDTNGAVVTGFVTCAHGFSSFTDGISVYHGTTRIGELVGSKVSRSGSADAAFVRLNDGMGMTNNVPDLSTLKTIILSKGSPVNLYGMTSDQTSGIVSQISYEYKSVDDPSLYTDLVAATYSCANGDSGGLVYAADPESSSSTKYIVGVHKGRDGSLRGVYCKAGKVIIALDVLLY